MKKSFLLILLIFAVFTLSLTNKSFSGTEDPGVSQTRHDLSMAGGGMWTYDTTEVCVFCHTPHVGQGTVYPLWNRDLSPATFSMYTSPTFNMTPNAIGSPSTLCMSCHDGNMAMNVVVNSPGRGTTGSIPDGGVDTELSDIYYPGSPFGILPNISGNYPLGNPNNLADDHPISFTYNPNDDQQGNNFPDIGGDGKITGAATTTKYPLYSNSNGSNQFECSTCHDVHDTAIYVTKDVSEVFFLRTSNAESRMCRDCHVAKY